MLMSASSCGKILVSRNKQYFELSQITIRASREPIEELNSICIVFDVTYENEHSAIISGQVGNMNVAIELINKEKSDQQLSSTFNMEGFKLSKQSIKNIRLKNKFESEAILIKTINGERSDHVDYIDAFVSGLQLGQILLYELDEMSRENSNNLWMRNVNFKFLPKEDTSHDNSIDVALENTSLMNSILRAKSQMQRIWQATAG